MSLRDHLPVMLVLLRSTGGDVPLDLAAALAAVYDEVAYNLSVGYAGVPPAPVFSVTDLE